MCISKRYEDIIFGNVSFPVLFSLLIFAICVSCDARAAIRSAIAQNVQAIDHGKIGAGEGPAWHRSGYLLFTGGGQIRKRDAQGNVSVFREDAGGANGLHFDHHRRLVVCESSRRRVTRTETDGSITILADNYRGSRFNTPNDLTIDSKGRVYFTDPRYGSRDTMEMRDEQGRLVEGVYRIDSPGQVTRVITHEVDRPMAYSCHPVISISTLQTIITTRSAVRGSQLPCPSLFSDSKPMGGGNDSYGGPGAAPGVDFGTREVTASGAS